MMLPLNYGLRFVVSHPFAKYVKGWGTQLSRLFDYQIDELTGNDDDLGHCFSGSSRPDLFVGQSRSLDSLGAGISGNANDIDQLAVDLDGNLQFVFFSQLGFTYGPGSAQDRTL